MFTLDENECNALVWLTPFFFGWNYWGIYELDSIQKLWGFDFKKWIISGKFVCDEGGNSEWTSALVAICRWIYSPCGDDIIYQKNFDDKVKYF